MATPIDFDRGCFLLFNPTIQNIVPTGLLSACNKINYCNLTSMRFLSYFLEVYGSIFTMIID